MSSTLTISCPITLAKITAEYVKQGVIFNVVEHQGKFVVTLTGGY